MRKNEKRQETVILVFKVINVNNGYYKIYMNKIRQI